MRGEPASFHRHHDHRRAGLLKGWRVGLVCSAALGFVAVSVPVAQAAQLDHSFGSDGVAFEAGSPSKQISPARKVVLDSRGRLVVLGNDRNSLMVVARFRSNGVLDGAFGSGGLAYVADFRRQNPIGVGQDLAVTSRGNILSTGSLGYPFEYVWNRDRCAFVSRQKSNGFLDHSFADDGRQAVCSDESQRKVGLMGSAIALGGNGKLVIAGQAWHGRGRSGAFIARLRDGGEKIDRSFQGSRRNRSGLPGVVEISPPRGFHAWFTEVKLLPKGKVLAAGTLRGRFLAARFLRNGRRDPAFGRNGVSSFDLDGQSGCLCSAAVGMARDRHGRILLAGYTMKRGLGDADLQPTVIRLKRNGRLDRSFGVKGVARPQLSEYLELPDGRPVRRFLTSGLTVQKDGKVVISGEYNFRYSLLRLKANGKPDRSFFDSGVYVDWVRGRYGAAWDVITDRKGRIVSSGGTSDGGFVLMRMLP